jgi:hypothetical protein
VKSFIENLDCDLLSISDWSGVEEAEPMGSGRVDSEMIVGALRRHTAAGSAIEETDLN